MRDSGLAPPNSLQYLIGTRNKGVLSRNHTSLPLARNRREVQCPSLTSHVAKKLGRYQLVSQGVMGEFLVSPLSLVDSTFVDRATSFIGWSPSDILALVDRFRSIFLAGRFVGASITMRLILLQELRILQSSRWKWSIRLWSAGPLSVDSLSGLLSVPQTTPIDCCVTEFPPVMRRFFVVWECNWFSNVNSVYNTRWIYTNYY